MGESKFKTDAIRDIFRINRPKFKDNISKLYPYIRELYSLKECSECGGTGLSKCNFLPEDSD